MILRFDVSFHDIKLGIHMDVSCHLQAIGISSSTGCLTIICLISLVIEVLLSISIAALFSALSFFL